MEDDATRRFRRALRSPRKPETRTGGFWVAGVLVIWGVISTWGAASPGMYQSGICMLIAAALLSAWTGWQRYRS